MTFTGPFAAIAQVATALDGLRVRYMVCGSVASSLHGEPRTTYATDLVVDLRAEHVDVLHPLLAGSFDVDAFAMREAVRSHSMFNLVAAADGLKVDVILLRDRGFSRVELSRAVDFTLLGGRVVKVATAEDTVLAKLEWFRKGGEVSERQWRDVRGILKAQGGASTAPTCASGPKTSVSPTSWTARSARRSASGEFAGARRSASPRRPQLCPRAAGRPRYTPAPRWRPPSTTCTATAAR